MATASDFRFGLVIGGVLFDEWLAGEGLEFGSVRRREVSMIAMSGKKHEKYISKKTISFKLVELNDAALAEMEAGLLNGSPVSVSYKDKHGIQHTDEHFFVADYSTPVKTVEAGIAYYSSISIELEEE